MHDWLLQGWERTASSFLVVRFLVIIIIKYIIILIFITIGFDITIVIIITTKTLLVI